MIKNLKPSSDKALINNELMRKYLIKLDSDILRGCNTAILLDIIANLEPAGAYGYQINQILKSKSKHTIDFEEATLYTLIKKLQKDRIIDVNKIKKRKYYNLTPLGRVIYDYTMGFFSNIAELLINYEKKEYSHKNTAIFCPNCSNRIKVDNKPPRFCRICGYYIENIIKELLKAKNLPVNNYSFIDHSTDLLKAVEILKS